MKAPEPYSHDQLSMSQPDEDHSWVVTRAPSHLPREGLTRSVHDWPIKGHDRQLMAKPLEQLAGHPPIGG